MMEDKPHAPSCDRNRDPILAVLRHHFAEVRQVLEIGSGTGQHAVYFAMKLPRLTWQCSDVADNLAGIRQWLDETDLPNTPPPLELDVDGQWPAQRFDAAFSANSLHIMGWASVQAFFAGLGGVLGARASLIVYGPFNYEGRYTSESNREFDAWLKARDPASGIRDFESVDALAQAQGFLLIDDVAMPANNRCLVWRKV